MRIRCLPIAAMATFVLTAPALAGGAIKCKIETSNIVFNLESQGGQTNVSIGTLSSAPKLVFKNVKMTTQADKTVVVNASPAEMVGTMDKLKCADLKKSFHLVLTPREGGKYGGELTMSPHYRAGSDRSGGCKGFAAPDLVEDSHANVVCLTSNP